MVVIIGWFGALFTGRLPDFAEEFLSGVLRWVTRVYAYLYFLTTTIRRSASDREDQYPLVVDVPPPVRLNPLAVLFRIILVIPAWIVMAVALYGLGVVSIASWAMILFTGKLPSALHESTRAVIRFYTRVAGYFSMLTPEYPWGLFGDGPLDGERSAEATPGVRGSWAVRLSSEGRTALIVMLVIGVVIAVFNRRF